MSTENRRLAEWLRQLGCPVKLSEENLDALNPPHMRSVWRHLQTHVMRKEKVQLIRKNLLLAKLKKQNVLPGQFGYTIESVTDLSEVQNLKSLQEQINSVKTEIKNIDDKLEHESTVLFTKICEKESIKNNTTECETKTVLLKLKLSQIQKDTEYISEIMDKADRLTFCQRTMRDKERMLVVKSEFPKFVSKYKSALFDMKNDDAAKIIAMGHGLLANVIYDGICCASRKALKSFFQFKKDFDVRTYIDSLRKKQETEGVSSFSKELNKMHAKIVQHEFSLKNYNDDINKETAELKKEMMLLIKLLNEASADSSESGEFEEEVVKFVDTLEKNAMLIKKEEIIKAFIDELDTDCSNFDSLKFEVETLNEQVNVTQKKVEENVNEINKLVIEISNNNVSAIKIEALSKCIDNAKNLFSRCKLDKYSELFQKAASMIKEEIEMFEKVPLVAITREWNNSATNILEDRELISLLSHSEPKNIVKLMLEKLIESRNMSDEKLKLFEYSHDWC